MHSEKPKVEQEDKQAFRVNTDTDCMICGQNPTVGNTDLCGPCCFGEADTAGGNW